MLNVMVGTVGVSACCREDATKCSHPYNVTRHVMAGVIGGWHRGLAAMQVECRGCSHRNVNSTSDYMIQVEVEHGSTANGLHNFFGTEGLHDYRCETCTRVGSSTCTVGMCLHLCMLWLEQAGSVV